jgi:hypothetical protein
LALTVVSPFASPQVSLSVSPCGPIKVRWHRLVARGHRVIGGSFKVTRRVTCRVTCRVTPHRGRLRPRLAPARLDPGHS